MSYLLGCRSTHFFFTINMFVLKCGGVMSLYDVELWFGYFSAALCLVFTFIGHVLNGFLSCQSFEMSGLIVLT